ncbi:hypothetical protein Bhyg_10843 [Pseudolycoriella hygida]|uniref:Uncharacterized protein n=1 Tax=Pseudolycoriella hygida TaxID=35572 RepID=A0A9Q0MU86_9DIPT|nr:hypothetical protein Bhyg_10843 [Pseudolycoriella hygida]
MKIHSWKPSSETLTACVLMVWLEKYKSLHDFKLKNAENIQFLIGVDYECNDETIFHRKYCSFFDGLSTFSIRSSTNKDLPYQQKRAFKVDKTDYLSGAKI